MEWGTRLAIGGITRSAGGNRLAWGNRSAGETRLCDFM